MVVDTIVASATHRIYSDRLETDRENVEERGREREREKERETGR